MFLKFNINDNELLLHEVFFIGEGFIIGTHPKTSKKCLFLSSKDMLNTSAVKAALHKLKLKATEDDENSFHNIPFKTLEEEM
jgi:adenine-specific DNA methylase